MINTSRGLRNNTINLSTHNDFTQIDHDQHFKLNFFSDNSKATERSILTDQRLKSSSNSSNGKIQQVLDQSFRNYNEFQQIKGNQKLSDFSLIQKVLKIIFVLTILLLIVFLTLNNVKNEEQNKISDKNVGLNFQQILDEKQMNIKNKEIIQQDENVNFLRQTIYEDLQVNGQVQRSKEIVLRDRVKKMDVNKMYQQISQIDIKNRMNENPVQLTDYTNKIIQKDIKINNKQQIKTQLINQQAFINNIQSSSNNIEIFQTANNLNQNLISNTQTSQINIQIPITIQYNHIQQPVQIQDITDIQTTQIQSNYLVQLPINTKTLKTFSIPFTTLSNQYNQQNQQNQQKQIQKNKPHPSFTNSKASIILQKEISLSSQVQQNQPTQPTQPFKIITFQPKQPIQNSQIQKQLLNKIKLQKQQREQQIACQDYIFKQFDKYGWLYQFLNTHKQFRKLSNADFFIEQFINQITQQKYSEAIDLLQLIHNVSPNGKLQVVDSPCESAQSLRQRLSSAMEKQHQRLDSIYQIDYYHKKQLRFCIVVNSYDNARRGLIYRNLNSILQQNYTNYHVVYTDDASTDNTGQKVKIYLSQKNSFDQRFKIKINKKKVGMMENIFFAVTQDCQSGEIVVMLDGDDSFIGTNVLSLLNAIYQKQKIAIMWNNYLQVLENSRVVLGISRDIDYYQKFDRSFRRTNKYLYSHLKSFYVELFRQIKVQDLQHEDGKFYGGASDTAMMFSMIEMAYPYYKYVPEIVYEYRYDTGQVGMIENKQAQFRALNKIDATTPYKMLSNFSFIDIALQNALVFL